VVVSMLNCSFDQRSLKTYTSAFLGREMVGNCISHMEEAQLTGSEDCATIPAPCVADRYRLSIQQNSSPLFGRYAYWSGCVTYFTPPTPMIAAKHALAWLSSAVITSGFLTSN
jgi:hypothetical protein